MQLAEAMARLHELADPAAMKGRARFGLPEEGALGVSLPQLRKLAREAKKDAQLARALWKTGVHDARLLATLVMDPDQLSRVAAEKWLRDVRSWDLCDGLCMNVIDKTSWAYAAAVKWARSEDEWVKRAGFATMASLAVHDKEAEDAAFAPFFAAIEKHGADDRNYVKKAVSWALRQMGKRSPPLRRKAIASAKRLQKLDSKGARWAGADALRELDR